MGAITSHYNLAIIIQEQRRGNAVRGLKQDLTLVNQRLDKHGIAAGKAANKTDQFKDKAKRLGHAIRKVLVPALLLATTAAVKFGTEGVKSFAKFDKGMQEVFTLLPDRTQELEDELTDGIKAVGKEFGYLTEESIPALYQALSAGVPEDNAIKAVELAAKAAKAGASDLESTMRIGMAVVNAYGGEIYSLEEAYDLIFQLVDKGVPRLADWGNTLQDVISIASEARTPFEDIVAALAVMTRQGDTAAESAELLGFILMQMQIEGTTAAGVFMEATGVSYREWIATGNGLVEGLQRIDQYAIDTGQHLDSMIGGSSNFYRDQQAARGTMELTGIHMQELIDLSKLVGEEMEGSMEKAYGTASDNAQQSLDELGAKWENIKLKIGEAIWEQGIFFGFTGEQAVDMVETTLDYVTGDLGDKLIDTLELAIAEVTNSEELKRIAKAWVSEDRMVILPSILPNFEAFKTEAAEGRLILAGELAGYYNTYHEFQQDMHELGLMPIIPMIGETDIGGAPTEPEDVFSMEENARTRAKAYALFFAGIEEQERHRDEQLAIRDEVAIERHERKIRMKETEASLDLEGIILGERLLEIGVDRVDLEANLSSQIGVSNSEWIEITQNAEEYGKVIHWMAIDSQKLNKEQLAFVDIVFQQGETLTTAFADLQAAGGEWTTIIKDSGVEISTIMGDLAVDLTNDERDIMQSLLSSAEEGGSDWLSAWRRLQSDLTETQRNELVARLADLQASQGNYEGVWTGDREKAIEAAGRIIGAFESIDEAYYTMGENMVTNKILTDIRLTDTVAGQLAALEWQVALGNIDEEIAEPMRKELEAAAKLEPILDEMYTAYMDDAVLAKEEAENMTVALDAVHSASKHLTREGLKALLDKMLSETGGYPYVGTVIRDDLNAELDNTAEKTKELTKRPIVPKVKLDKTTFDIVYDRMMIQIEEALGPHIVEFKAAYDGFNDGEANTGQATGTGGAWRRVPSGYPNDSYLVGLTSNEEYSVLTPGQQRQQGDRRQYVDQSRHTTIIHNHTAAAAAVSRAYLDTLYDQRLRRFVGE